MNANTSILVAVAESEASNRAVSYVATLLGRRCGHRVCLFHVLPPMPSGLLEFGGAEAPAMEERLEKDLKAAQAQWVAKDEQAAAPILANTKAILHKAGVPTHSIETQITTLINGQDLVTEILAAAQASQYGTVVVGREAFSGLKELFYHHVGDELLRRGQGFTIGVVK
jgi:nucleotide-binding universal stress UspA family protein